MEIKFHGQSCFEISDGSTTVLTDPFLKPNNPVAVATADEVEATVIAISHGHADHIAVCEWATKALASSGRQTPTT